MDLFGVKTSHTLLFRPRAQVVHKIITLLLVVAFVFSNVQEIVQLSFLPSVDRAYAASGDYAIFRESSGTASIDGSGTPFDSAFDTTVQSNSNIVLQGNESDIDLSDGGKYLVLYSAWAEQGTSTAGTNRRLVNTYLTLNDAELAYGQGGGYIRDSEGDLTAYAAGGAVIDSTAGDYLQLHARRVDANPTAGTNIPADTNGISVLKLPDSWDYLRARRAADSAAVNGNTSFTAITWDTSDETDTGSYSFSPTSGDITLKGADGKHFLVTMNVGLYQNASAGTRQNYESALFLDGVEIDGTRTTTYIRGTDGTYDGTLVYSGIITKTSTSDQTLNVRVRRESTGSANTVVVGGKTGISVVALPDTAEYIRLTDTSGTQTLAATRQSMSFDTQPELDTTAFSHSTSSNASEVTLNKSGSYLFFSTVYDQTTTSGNNRQPHRIDWRKNGSTLFTYGGHGGFNRANSTFTAGSSGGLIMSGMSAADYIEVTHIDETTSAPVDATFASGRVALQGVALNENFFGTDVLISATGTHTTSVSVPQTEVYAGGVYAVTENSSARNVTSITLTESGTVDAQTGLDNIKLLYDLDTTAPYDCASESYSGSESQFGSTDTNGFSGADGVSSFTSSVSITTTQTMCVYIVYDVTNTAADSETVSIAISDPSSDVTVSGGGSIGPITSVAPSGMTTLGNAELTQIHYHWRHDDGNETDTPSSAPTIKTTTTDGFSANIAGNDPTLTVPASAVAGDYMVVVYTTDDNNPTQTITPPANETWTLQESGFMPIDGTGAVSPPGVWIYTKVVSADDEANAGTKTYTWQDSVGSEEQAGLLILLSGVGGWGQLATNLLTGNRTNIDAPSITTGVANELVFHAAFKDAGVTFTGLPSGTPVTNSVWGATSNAGAALAMVAEAYTSPGATGVKNFTHANVASNGFTFSLTPATAGATSIDGTEDTPAIGFANGTINRLRLEVSAEGSVSSGAVQYRLEYAPKVTTCAAASGWTDVGTGGSGDWDVVDSSYLTDGGDTTNITSASYGALTDENVTFLASNAGIKDASSQTGNITLSSTEFVELEYALEPTSGAPQGTTYCFRVTDAGTPIKNYAVYPEATVSADIDVLVNGSHVTNLTTGTTDQYLGGTFVVTRNGAARTLTELTLTETGTIDAALLTSPRLYYDLDTTAPYDCASESYAPSDSNLSGSAFTASNGSTTFSTSITVSSTQTFCGYLVFDIATAAQNGETIKVEINNPSSEVVVTGSTVGPNTAISPTGNVTVIGPIITQTHYHWRNDDGTETSATSATGGTEDTPILDVPHESPRRLRLGVSNEGTVADTGTQYRLEYGTKVSTCAAVGTWTDVASAGGAFALYDSANLTEGADTTDVAAGTNGSITNENTTFLTPNGGVRDTTSETGSLSLSTTEFTEFEYAIEVSADAAYDTTYCFRVTDAGTPLQAYTTYAELTTRQKQDFYVQRGTSVITGTSLTLTAGSDYVAPGSANAAFLRITNTQITGAGNDTGGGNQNADDVTVYVSNPSNLATSITLARPGTATGNTIVSWEILEFVGLAGGDNEMIVRDQGTVTTAVSTFTAAGAAVGTVVDDAQVVVFITGQQNDNAGTANYNDGTFIASWNASLNQPEFTRGDADVNAALSYAVVEFTGANWNVQRITHTYSAAAVTETESISPVTSLAQTFIHTQNLVGTGLSGLDEFGTEVWLSSIGALSFRLESGASSPTDQTTIAWVIENTQAGTGAMAVQRLNGTLVNGACSGAEPCTESLPLGNAVNTANASLFANNRSTGSGTAFPRTIVGMTIASSTAIDAFRSDTGQSQAYRIEVVLWPVAEVAVRQNYYRWYADNDSLTPNDPWPAGVSDIGENAALTALDDPIAEGEHIRLRVTGVVGNANLPELSKSYKLQYGKQDSTCSAIVSWTDVGAPGSGEVWRGYDATPIDGTPVSTSTPSAGTLLISVADVAGTYEEQNPSAVNPYLVTIGEDVEYDWHLEHNGALQRSDYCFRMVEADDTVLPGYNHYPTLRTTGYTPVSANWRWYDDATSTTPGVPLAAENTAPSDVVNGNVVKLRLGVHEIENASGANTDFAVQYSESADFSDGGHFVRSSSTCQANSLWCYADGGGVDHALIDSVVLTDSDSCVSSVGTGCGTYNEGTTTPSTLTQPAASHMEFDFTLQNAGARANAVYYFRLYDLANDAVVAASSSYPSLLTEATAVSVTAESFLPGAVVEGEILTSSSTATTVSFTELLPSTTYVAAQRFALSTNATDGYQVFVSHDQPLTDAYGGTIPDISATNASPDSWGGACTSTSLSCFGYHPSDDVLSGSSARFAPQDTFAGLTTNWAEVFYSSVPGTFTLDMVYKLWVGDLQQAGVYQTGVSYLYVPFY